MAIGRLGAFLAIALGAAILGCSADGSDAGSDDAEQIPGGAFGKADGFGGVSVNDVSYLFPLPKAGEHTLLLRLADKGPKGELLPKKHYDAHIPYLWEGFFREQGYNWSRILALRIDPCASELTVDESTECRAEVRLSAQPLWGDEADSEPMTSTVDAALHLIYELSQEELAAMFGELMALRKAAGNDYASAPLGRHPVMVREGLKGPFAKGLRAVILKYVGASNLVKFTMMDRGRNSTNWRFAQFVKKGNGFAPEEIPAAHGAEKQGVNELGLNGQTNTRDTLVSPVDEAIGYPVELAKSEEVEAMPKAELEPLLGRLAGFEDPRKTSNETLDCASCHLSQNARPYFETLTGVATPKKYLTFKAPGQNLKRNDETKLSGNVLRAFGYMGQDVAISQRTINESARVAGWLSKAR
jgi:hypothetical protein